MFQNYYLFNKGIYNKGPSVQLKFKFQKKLNLCEDGKIVIPFSFHRQFQARKRIEAVIANFNAELPCLKFHKVKTNEVRRSKFTNGIFFVDPDFTDGNCWGALGKNEGFKKPGINVKKLASKNTWQLIRTMMEMIQNRITNFN